MEYNIRLSNGQVLRGIIRSPGEKQRAIIIFVHGLGEHINRYNHLADFLNNEKIGFTGMDLPGHGRSDGKRGHISSFKLTDEMLDILLESSCKTFCGVPVFIYGHSLGGGIVLDYLLRKRPKIKGSIVTSPWLRLSFEPSKTKIRMASFVRYLVPGLIQPSDLVVEHISHDQEVVARYKSDPLVHDKISVSLFHSAVKAAGYSLAHAADLHVPLLLLHGTDDLICSPEGSREFASKTDKAHLKLWEGGYHELQNEVFKEDILLYIRNWIDNQLSNPD